MTRLLLDTTFLIDADRASTRLEETIEDDDEIGIAAITVAELQVGVLLAEGERREARRAYVEEVLASIPVLEYDVSVAAGTLISWPRCASLANHGEHTTSSSRRPRVPLGGWSSLPT